MRIVNMDLDEDFLKRFYDLTGDKVPETITIVSLKKQVLNIRDRFRSILADSNGASTEQDDAFVDDSAISVSRGNIVLLVDNLGVVTYQVQMIMSKLGFQVTSTKDVYGALSLFEDKEFDFVLMDLLIPTEREGFILLAEIKRIAAKKGIKPIIGVMSVAGKKELKAESLEKGADFYLEKSNNWQKRLTDIVADYINEGDFSNEN